MVSQELLAARPNDGSGLWADASNTGYLTGTYATPTEDLADYRGGKDPAGGLIVSEPNGTILTGRRFVGKTYLGYNGGGDDLTFRNCLFEGTWPNDNLVQMYCPTKITFENCTFRPYGLTSPPGNETYENSTALAAPGTPYPKSWQYIANMVPGQVATFSRCDVWGNAGIQATGGRDDAHTATFDSCYIHDPADNDGSGGSNYHHDGIGPDSEGGSGYTLIRGCTIAGRGNTNAIALQGSSTYHHIIIDGNYLSGYGYALAIGATQPWQGKDITVINNVYSTEVHAMYGPFYNRGQWHGGGGTNVWRGNQYQVKSEDVDAFSTDDHGKYWWPSDDDPHAADYGAAGPAPAPVAIPGLCARIRARVCAWWRAWSKARR